MMENKEEKDELRRVEFILDEKEMQFEKNEAKTLFEGLDVSPESIMENPMNLVLSNFENEYMKNERIGVVLFESLQNALRKYMQMFNENFFYQDMEITLVVNDLLNWYKTWNINQRGLILNTRDMVRQIKEMVDTEYITKKSLEKFQEELKLQISEEKRLAEAEFIKAEVKEKEGILIIELPKNSQLKKGDSVDYKKS